MRKLLILFLALPLMAQNPHGVTLNWLASPDAATNPTLSYNIYRATGGIGASGCSNATSKIGSATTLTFNDPNVSVGQTYCYTVRATLNGSESIDTAPASATVPIAPASDLTITIK